MDLPEKYVSLQQFTKNLSFSSSVLNETLKIGADSRKEAKCHPELFHCTSADILLNIVKNREFWLSSLECVNDKEEANRITIKQYEQCCYIASFTFDDNITPELWNEYGKGDNGVLFSIFQHDFNRDAKFITDINNHVVTDIKIYSDPNSCISEYSKYCVNLANFNPPPIQAIYNFDFYKIRYDNDLVIDMQSKIELAFLNKTVATNISLFGDAIDPNIIGIIKKKIGICNRDGHSLHELNWENENEIRLKLLILAYPIFEERRVYTNRIAVSLSPNAFSYLKIRFSPKFTLTGKKDFLNKLKLLLPKSEIEDL